MSSSPDFDTQFNNFTKLASNYPSLHIYTYGTAGFRTLASTLHSVMLRVGALASLHSLHNNAAIGVMITASHNLECDNGVKIVEPYGDMLNTKYEKYATELSNCKIEDLSLKLYEYINLYGVNNTYKPIVFIGCDTRNTSPELTQLVINGAKALNATICNLGLVTTPQLHHAVRLYNKDAINWDKGLETPKLFLDYYYNEISSSFERVMELYPKLFNVKMLSNWNMDCANGVGSISASNFAKLIKSLNIKLINNTILPGTNNLNVGCGSEYVQKSRLFPGDPTNVLETDCFASLDGDADRLVCFYQQGKNTMVLDGDKMTSLIVYFFKKLLEMANLKLSIGAVQTAYANGASTEFLRSVGVSIDCTCTGVKYLHPAAHHYDIGVYFEANGHGTVVFGHEAEVAFNTTSDNEKENTAILILRSFLTLVNQAVGDAISDFLLIASILCALGWDLKTWDAMYFDLPSVQSKVVIPDRSVIKTADAERVCTSPLGLQDKINSLVSSSGPLARSFVRPSGTEDIVRVYAEATTKELAEKLAKDVEAAVSSFTSA